jgi:hypothetical protein
MKLFPSQEATLYSALPKAEVLDRLYYNVQPEHMAFAHKDHPARRFQGHIEGSSFTIKRVIGYRNSFLPVITGSLSELPKGTRINLRLKPMRRIAIIMTLWFGTAILLLIITVIASLTDDGSVIAAFIPLAMLAVGVALQHICFNTECERSIEELKSIFEVKQNFSRIKE